MGCTDLDPATKKWQNRNSFCAMASWGNVQPNHSAKPLQLNNMAICINAGHLGNGELDSNQRSLYYELINQPMFFKLIQT